MKRAYRARQPAAKRQNYRRQTQVPRNRPVYSRGEMKYYDNEYSAAIVASTDWTGTEADPTSLTLFAPQEGSGINQRIGRSADVYKIKIRGNISVAAQANQTAADVAALVRLILVQDMQTNAAQMQGEQLMTDPSSVDANVVINSFQSLVNFGRFKVMMDKTLSLRQASMTYDGTNIEQAGYVIPFKFTLNFRKPIRVRFNATANGSVTDIVDNSFHIIANCTSTAQAPTLNYQSRVCFKE